MSRPRAVDFAGATAVVTGGASGIGKGIATVLAEARSNVVLADRDEAALDEAAAGLGALGVPTDVADPDSVAALVPGTVRTNIAHSLRFRPPDEASGLHELGLAAARSDYRFIDPVEVGRMVLAAIRGNDRYLLTHPELLPLADGRHAALRAGAARSSSRPAPGAP